MKTLDLLALVLLLVGGLNWGLIGLFDCNIVTMMFGIGSNAAKAIYTLVGLSSLYYALFWQNIICRCSSSASASSSTSSHSCCRK